MVGITDPRRLTPDDFANTPSHPSYKAICDKLLTKNPKAIVVDSSNLSDFIDSLKPKGIVRMDNVLFNRVDLKGVFNSGVIFDTCTLFDCLVPDNCAYFACSSHGTSIGSASGVFHCHIEPLKNGRVRIGNNCYVEDSSLMPGSILGKNSIYYSRFGAQNSHAHYESNVTVYGGYHFENTYEPEVSIYTFVGNSLKKDIEGFLAANNKSGIFDDYLGESAHKYLHEYDFFLSAYGEMPFIEYPDEIYSTSQLVNKTPNARNAFLNVLGGLKGRHEEHRTLTKRLFSAYEPEDAPYKTDAQIRAIRKKAFFELNLQLRNFSESYLSSIYSKAGYQGDDFVNLSAVDELVKSVGDRCLSSYNNSDSTLERINKYMEPAGVQIKKESLDLFFEKSSRLLTLHSGYMAPEMKKKIKFGATCNV
jgi:hypothetical protein